MSTNNRKYTRTIDRIRLDRLIIMINSIIILTETNNQRVYQTYYKVYSYYAQPPILFLRVCFFMPREILINPIKFLAAIKAVDLFISIDLFFFVFASSTSAINVDTPHATFAFGYFDDEVPVPIFFPSWLLLPLLVLPNISDLPITEARTFKLLAFLEVEEFFEALRRSFRCTQSGGAVLAVAQDGGALNREIEWPRLSRVSL